MRYEIIKGICRGLHFLHESNIVHLDLKPQNILLDDTMMPKIADFGLSRLLGEQKSRTVTLKIAGTFGYMAPEYINQGIISPKADIFSLGVIIIEIQVIGTIPRVLFYLLSNISVRLIVPRALKHISSPSQKECSEVGGTDLKEHPSIQHWKYIPNK